MKTLKEYVDSDGEDEGVLLSESSLLSKGYALGQLTRFRGEFQKFKSQRSRLRNTISRVRGEDETDSKIELLATALEEVATLIAHDAALKQFIMNAIVADNLLSGDLKKLILKRK